MANEPAMTPSVSELLERLRQDYLARLPEDFADLARLSSGLTVNSLDNANLESLHHKLHKLAGSGGTFGFSSLSTQARALEKQVKTWLDNTSAEVSENTLVQFAGEIASLGESMKIADVDIPSISNAETDSRKKLTIWIVEDDSILCQALTRQLEPFNYDVKIFNRIADAEVAAETQHPDMLVMDVMFENENENATEVLVYRPILTEMNCPFLFISSTDDFQSRVRASQLGASGYVLKPLDVPRLVNRMEQVFACRRSTSCRVLIVDDDIELATHYRLVLLEAGMEAEILIEARIILDKISNYQPDIILMDVNMPDISGPDMAGVIRQFDKWFNLPIVYLSADTDLKWQVKAIDRGADDFLIKPISDAQLVSAVRAHIERACHFDGQISRDSLTGLLKHSRIKESVEFETLRARRQRKPVSVAMLDIDHFKRVNDTYGHAAGDVVISAIALLLRQRLRQSDIIGRYGGEEFAVVLPDCDASTAEQILNDLRVRFASLNFNHEGKDFSCSISIGLACITQFPECNGAELLLAADAALYAAKKGGRNKVRIAPAILANKERIQ